MKNIFTFLPRGVVYVLVSIMLITLHMSAFAATRTITEGPIDVLSLNGVVVGYPEDVRGGYPLRSLAAQQGLAAQSESNWLIQQPMQQSQWPPLEFSFSNSMGAAWYQWLVAQLSQPEQNTLSLLRLDGGQKASQVSGSAILIGLEYPAVDRAQALTGRIRVKVGMTSQPQITLSPPGPAPAGKPALGAPTISTQVFRFSLQGLEAAAQSAVSVSAITVSRKDWTPANPTKLEVSSFVVRLPQSAGVALQDWYAESVLGSNPSRRPGLLEYMDKMGNVVASAGLVNVGLLGLTPISDKGVALVEATLFCDKIVPQFMSPAVL